MLENKFFLWFGMMFPLIFSAGPANVTMASLGARFGFLKSLPFISGINLIVFFHALLIGFGAGAFLKEYPVLFRYLQYAGSAYLIYLASKFFRLSRLDIKETSDSIPNFLDGIILQLLNMKVVTVTMVMFSQFLDMDSGQFVQVMILSIGLAALTTGATMIWAIGGAWLTRIVASEKSVKLQGYIFGSMLIGVSIWMLI
jgi:threonine/homoserine/homoserine lactone efflux protein